MGYLVNVHVPPPGGVRYGVARDTALALAAGEIERRQLPATCPECGSQWRMGSATAVGSSGEDWTFTFRCAQGHP